MRLFTFFFLSIYIGSFAHAEEIKNIASCQLRTADFNLSFILSSDKTARLLGKVKDEAINCNLSFERVIDDRKSRSSQLFRVETFRTEESCKPKLSHSLNRGLEDKIDLYLYSKHAEIYLFEGYDKIKCNSSHAFKSLVISLSKSRSLNSMTKSRKSKKLFLPSLIEKKK